MRFFRPTAPATEPATPAPTQQPRAHEVIAHLNDQSAYKMPLPSLEDSLAILRAAHGGKRKLGAASRLAAVPPAGPPRAPSHLNRLPARSRGAASSRAPEDPELPPYTMPPSYADVTNRAFDSADPSSPLYTQGRDVHIHSLSDSVRILRAHAGRGAQ